MRTPVLPALAVAAVVVLSGCVGLTGEATQVTQTAARLNADGRTGDSTTRFHFRYANSEADLGTDAARRTPERTIPAHVPADGRNITFGQNVTGLTPGRLYFFELCGRDAGTGSDLCGGVKRFVTRPGADQDAVEARVFSGFPPSPYTLTTVEAASGPGGQNADGRVTVHYRGGAPVLFEGRVTCLNVLDDERAVVGTVGTAYSLFGETPPEPSSRVFTLSESGPSGTLYAARSQSPPDCSVGDFGSQTQLYGESEVTDAP